MSGHTVSDFVKAGGPGYKPVTDNCWGGTTRMMNLGDK